MSIYTVHVPETAATPQEETAQAVFVMDGFSRPAFVFAPLWCVVSRAWLGLLVWGLAIGAMLLAARWLEIPPPAVYAATFLLHLLFGLEAAQLRRRSLFRRGYALADVVSADNEAEARLTFDLRLLGAQAPAYPAPGQIFTPPRPRPVRPDDGIGLAPLGGGA